MLYQVTKTTSIGMTWSEVKCKAQHRSTWRTSVKEKFQFRTQDIKTSKSTAIPNLLRMSERGD